MKIVPVYAHTSMRKSDMKMCSRRCY